MTKYRTKPEIVEATQWFKNGDHPYDNCKMLTSDTGEPFLSEGKVVRYYRDPEDSLERLCEICGKSMLNHGWIDTDFYDGYVVCPGDWIITKEDFTHCAIRRLVFEAKYERLYEESNEYWM